jgi:hypothetical protein
MSVSACNHIKSGSPILSGAEYPRKIRVEASVITEKFCSPVIDLNSITPELNPSAHRCLARFFTEDFASWTVHFVNTCVKNQQMQQLFIQFINPYPTNVVYIYIYGALCKARNFNVVYIWTYVWQRWKPALSICCTMFHHWINAEIYPVAQLCVNTLPATMVTLITDGI